MDDSTETYEYLSSFYSYGYEPYFQNSTRSVVGQKESCIDNAFIKTKFLIESYRINYQITDHYTLLLKLHIDQSNLKKYEKIKKNNYKKFIELSYKVNWSEIYYVNDIDTATNLLVEKIKYLIEITPSCETVKNKPKKSWVTNEIVTLINKKEKLYKEWKKNIMNLNLRTKYYDIVKLLKKKIENAKELYEKRLIDEFKNNQQKIWNFVNSKLNKRKKNKMIEVEKIKNEISGEIIVEKKKYM